MGKALGERNGRSRTLVRTGGTQPVVGLPVPAQRALTLAFAFTRVTSSPHNLLAVVLVGAVVREEHVGSGRDRCSSAASRARTSSGRSLPMPEVPLQRLAQSSRLCQGWRLRGLRMCSTSKELLTEPMASTQCLSATLTSNPNQFTPSLHDP